MRGMGREDCEGRRVDGCSCLVLTETPECQTFLKRSLVVARTKVLKEGTTFSGFGSVILYTRAHYSQQCNVGTYGQIIRARLHSI